MLVVIVLCLIVFLAVRSFLRSVTPKVQVCQYDTITAYLSNDGKAIQLLLGTDAGQDNITITLEKFQQLFPKVATPKPVCRCVGVCIQGKSGPWEIRLSRIGTRVELLEAKIV